MIKYVPLVISLFVLGCAPAEESAPGADTNAAPVTARVVEELDTASLNRDAGDMPTVDIGMYLIETDSERYNERMPQDEIHRRYELAREVFAGVGVNLNLMWIRLVEVNTDDLEIESNVMLGSPAGDIDDLYEKSRQQRSALSPEAEAMFEAIIEPDPANDRTVYLVGMEDVIMNWYEQQDSGDWEIRSDPTNALSFPSYTLEDRIPRRLRGVITVQNIFKSQKIIAHELGHKLINVSHEYRDINPAHEVDAEGGLMVYGEGTEIPAGEEGRWHHERLMLSPYLYRMVDGEKVYNRDYQESGHYADPIYQGLTVRN
ncbi:MAG: hypothetical protein HKN29_13965 [Rhodothermales bacterium]|nr:hypothetical protein [Rhodothermales bacterium]